MQTFCGITTDGMLDYLAAIYKLGGHPERSAAKVTTSALAEKMHVSPYEPATRDNPTDPMRRRKLLLHRHEIDRLEGRIAEKGLTLVPVCVYFKRGRAKVELALARGKHRHDKRETIKRREGEREAQRAMRRHTR